MRAWHVDPMKIETITDNDDLLIRRLTLDPGEAMYWHTDACRRFSVVVSGCRLTIEYLESAEIVEVDVYPGLADWDEPDPRIHRAINRDRLPYEEVVTFFRTRPDQEPQPIFSDVRRMT